MNGIELLNEFRERQSECAFSELVHRYTNLVYSVAARRLTSQSLAQEAAQTVFIRLAKSPPRLGNDADLTAWLHRTTVHVSIDLWRSEVRRRAREEHAAAMQPNLTPDLSWKEIAPALDEALNELNDIDRQTILLRFFDEKPMRDLGSAFGISEDAAKMRVSRALDRLRDQLSARGVTCTSLALGAFLAERSLEAAPTEVAGAIASFHYPIAQSAASAAAVAGSFTATVGLAKVVGGLALITLAGVTTWFAVHRQQANVPVASGSAAGVRSEGVKGEKTATAANQNTAVSAEAAEPDPVKLLQAVARARQRIGTGSIEFRAETIAFARPETNRIRVSALFDGAKQRFEQFGREYAYTYDPEPARAEEIKSKADAFGADREGAVAAGLLSGFEAHRITTYDGTSLMGYRESDGKPEGATIDDPGKGTSSFVFDPRCLGLTPWLGPRSTIESCLRSRSTNQPEFLGKDAVDGISCWHLRVPAEQRFELWLDVAHPTRVLKVLSGAAVVVSKYEPTVSGDPLPKEVVSTDFRNGAPAFQTRFARTVSQFNITVDPATFTLAGLGMKVGTDVVDVRIHRSIGYWTGTGLSENLPPKKKPVAEEAPNLEELLTILDNDPASLAALDAATWILLNTPDGPAVEKAAAVIMREHVRSPELGLLCQQMERVRPRCARELLETVLKENPSAEIRAMACFTLATLRKDECKYGADKRLTAEAETLFERVINEFGKAGATGAELARKAKPELSELRRLTIGKVAPDFEGTDLQGRHIKLSEQRGKVVVVCFWIASMVDDLEEQRRILARFDGRPLVWLGINCDNDRARALDAVEKHQITWPVIWDDRTGPISGDWNVHSWSSVFLLDRNGVIRSRASRGPELGNTVATLLAE